MPRSRNTARAPGPAVIKADAALLLRLAVEQWGISSHPHSRSPNTARAPVPTVPEADADLLELLSTVVYFAPVHHGSLPTTVSLVPTRPDFLYQSLVSG